MHRVRDISQTWRSTLLGIASLLILGACARSLVSASDCSVRQLTSSGQIELSALIRNSSSKVAQTVYVIVSTSGIGENRREAQGGSDVQYTINGPLSPNTTVKATTLKTLSGDDFSDDARLGSVTSCEVHAVIYEDGSHWEGPSPL